MRRATVAAGSPIHFADFGGTGTPIVLVHGLGGSHVNWLAVGPALAEHGWVVAPDLPGFGRTPPVGRSSGVEAHRESLHRFLTRVIGRPAVVIGSSMGGLLAMMEAALQPEIVSRLVLVAPVQPRPQGQRIDRQVLAAFLVYSIPWVGEWHVRRRSRRLGPEGIVRDLLRLLCVEPCRVPADVRAAHVALMRERLEEMPWTHRAFLQAARSLLAVLRHRRRLERLVDSIPQPTLLIHGARDRLVPLAASRALARRRPDWPLEVMPDIGHVPHLEAPSHFVRIVGDWLARMR